MGNNYNLEYKLLQKSRLTNRAPFTITQEVKAHIDGYDKCECGCKKYTNS
jgi:hypothetical protein